MFLPTVGDPVMYEEDTNWSTLEMNNPRGLKRDVRKELELEIENCEDVEIDMKRFSQSRSLLLDDLPGSYDKVEEQREKSFKC